MQAFYSAKMAEHSRVVYWLDADGNEVECTLVHDTMDHGAQWPDMVYKGEVVKYSRSSQNTPHYVATAYLRSFAT